MVHITTVSEHLTIVSVFTLNTPVKQGNAIILIVWMRN